MRARKLDAKIFASRQASWKEALGLPSSRGGPSTPTRLAFRWSRGLTGWTRCLTGPASYNNEVPHEEDGDDFLTIHLPALVSTLEAVRLLETKERSTFSATFGRTRGPKVLPPMRFGGSARS